MARFAVALGRGVAEHLDAVGVDDDDAVAQLVERGQETITLTDDGVGLLQCPGQRQFELGGLVTPQRAHDINRTVP